MSSTSSPSKSSTTNWFSDRTWSVSGNKEQCLSTIASKQHHNNNNVSVIYPKSTQEISNILSNNQDAKISVVCGGHCASNVATWPFLSSSEYQQSTTIIIDMKDMSSISVNKETNEVTVGGGSLFKDLAEICKQEGTALPIGTGDTVGVCGYTLNGGISGYFGKRLGMLGQRVTALQIVLASGQVKVLTPNSTGEDGDLFRCCLGAGSAIGGVVTSLTLVMEDGSAFKTGGSLVCACSNKDAAKPFLKKALLFLTENVLQNPSVSMEIVITSDFTVICTFMFYDTFVGDTEEFVQQLRTDAKDCNISIVADGVSSHKTYFDAASSLWEVIGSMKGDPLVRNDHCIGTSGKPSEEVLNFVLDKWIGEFLTKAALSLVEIRTLGGAAAVGNAIPSGNAKCLFFADMIVSYDGSAITSDFKASISSEVQDILLEAKKMKDLMVDFSGTHSQSDDAADTLPDGGVIFGSDENYEMIRSVKKKNDARNRFCYHPFAHLV